MLGHGLSKVEKAKDKIDHTIHHIDSILKNEGYSKAHFVGVSMGTLIAQYYSLHYPDKVQSMTILGGYDINANNKEISKGTALRKYQMDIQSSVLHEFLQTVCIISFCIPTG
ncbi:MAG: alpha/beta hydrolase [Marinilabiliales bacterium]|nr:alpha/beta hydrolase [Marinilabiliales bacterium]